MAFIDLNRFKANKCMVFFYIMKGARTGILRELIHWCKSYLFEIGFLFSWLVMLFYSWLYPLLLLTSYYGGALTQKVPLSITHILPLLFIAVCLRSLSYSTFYIKMAAYLGIQSCLSLCFPLCSSHIPFGHLSIYCCVKQLMCYNNFLALELRPLGLFLIL